VDAGGSATIQVVGGLTALAMAWIMGRAAASTPPMACPPRFRSSRRVRALRLPDGMGRMAGLEFGRSGVVQRHGPRRAVLVAVNTTARRRSAALMTALVTVSASANPMVR